jgi:hypothetical protein
LGIHPYPYFGFVVAMLSYSSTQNTSSACADRTVSEDLYCLGEGVVQALENNDRQTAIQLLERLANESDDFPASRIQKLTHALATDSWQLLGDDFINQDFIGKNGSIFILGPYSRFQGGKKSTKITAILGQTETIDLPIKNLEQLASKTFGPLFQPLAPMLPLQSFAVCGSMGQQEAFLSPDGWGFPNSSQGPALIDLTAHRQRFEGWIQARIKKIFEPRTADLLLQVLEDPICQLQEYCLHEAGHSVGLGLKLKMAKKLLPTYEHRAWEEYKTDIAGFHLADQALLPEQVGRLIAATLCIRFGIDAHRPGGVSQDHDVYACLLMLDRLLLSGHVRVLDNGQLELMDASFERLYQATAPHRREALYLIEQELSFREKLQNYLESYGGRSYQPETKVVFDQLIALCD